MKASLLRVATLPSAPAAPIAKVRAINPSEVEALVAGNETVIILDVRTPSERSAGFFAGSTNVDFRAADFQDQLASFDRSKTYVVHCVRGQKRTSDTVAALDQLGFTNVLALEGGYEAWLRDGKPVEK
ncbi:MAG: rhodanese-like domain-containing protein [Verrucomicrobiae bacterium]|nr:rhodanese-like domain-containing protein [Verrucomicrobiae bacterium]